MDQRDEYLITLAEVKLCIAKAERRLAQWRTKETLLLHNLQYISQEVACKRVTQADINLERTKSFQQCLNKNPGLFQSPSNILSTLTRPSMNLADVTKVA